MQQNDNTVQAIMCIIGKASDQKSKTESLTEGISFLESTFREDSHMAFNPFVTKVVDQQLVARMPMLLSNDL